MSNELVNGQTLGPFEIISELGRGGMAVVYKARQTDLQRMVALKILPPELSRDQSYLQRFLHEARSAAALEHPHIVPIYAIGEAQGFHYIAMKFIAGRTLKDVAQDDGALSLAQTATLLEQVAGALDYAHSNGVIHRDIKPSNMMVEPNGWVYLTDFGLARGGSATQGLTLAGTVMGTPEYMSPEQAQGLATIGPATDIYALGVVVYELLTGKVPFSADTPMGMLVARLQYAPRPPRDYRGDLPLAVEDVIMRALARRPEARFPSASALVDALKQASGLGTRSLTPQQRPASPPMGMPAVSPPFGVPSAPSLPTNNSQPVVPSATPPPMAAARPATPLVQPAVGFGDMPTAPATPFPNTPATPLHATPAMPLPTAPAAPERRSRRGLWIALGALALIIVLALAFDLVVSRGPDPAIAKGLQEGQAALAQPNGLDAAAAAYGRVLTADPKNIQAHNQLALIAILRDRSKQAEMGARAALALDSNSALAHALLAEALSSQNKYPAGLDEANKAVELNDKLAFAYSARAEVQANIGVENSDSALLNQAEQDAEKSLSLATDDDPLSKAMAQSAIGFVAYQRYALTGESGALDAAIDAMEQAVELQGQMAVFHSNLGYFYDAQGDHEKAQKSFEDALAADDAYGHTHAGLGWNLYYGDDYAGALGEFDKAIAANADDLDAYFGKSAALQHQSTPDYAAAAAVLAQAASVAPNVPSVPTKQGWLLRAQGNSLSYGSDEQKAAYAQAEQQFRKATQLNAKYAEAFTGLGWILQDQANLNGDTQQYQESVDVLKQSLALQETQSSAHNALGWSYRGLQQYDDAEQAFRRATELDEQYADAFYGLGRTLEDLGKNDDARDAYQSALDNGSADAQAALDALK